MNICGLQGHVATTSYNGGAYCLTCAQVAQAVVAVPSDPISPSHYVKGDIEVRHVIRAFECTYNVGTAIAYLLRAKFKANYVEDIRKAVQHLQFELEDKEKAK